MNHSAAIAHVEDSPKRRQIREAAEGLFLAHGYGAVSMDQVARTAGVSKATLYAHFTSKESLFANVMQDKRLDTPLFATMFPAVVEDLRAELHRMGEHLLRFMLRERTLTIYRVALTEAARFPELGVTFYETGPVVMRDRFATWIGRLHEAGLVDVPEEERLVAADQYMALMRAGVFFRRSLSVPPEPPEEEIQQTVRTAVRTWLKAFGTAATV